jgi:hypothetical protein
MEKQFFSINQLRSEIGDSGSFDSSKMHKTFRCCQYMFAVPYVTHLPTCLNGSVQENALKETKVKPHSQRTET